MLAMRFIQYMRAQVHSRVFTQQYRTPTHASVAGKEDHYEVQRMPKDGIKFTGLRQYPTNRRSGPGVYFKKHRKVLQMPSLGPGSRVRV